MYQSIFGSILASDLITIVLAIVMGLGFNYWIRPMISENQKLKEQHHKTLEHLPTLADYEHRFEVFKTDLRDIINRYEDAVSDDVRRELAEHLYKMEEAVKTEMAASQEMFESYAKRLEEFSASILEYHNDTKTKIEKTEAQIKASKYQYANVTITLEKIITVNQEFSKFFMGVMKDIEEKGLLTKINYTSLQEINNILVSINDESMRVMVKVKAEQDAFEKLISD